MKRRELPRVIRQKRRCLGKDAKGTSSPIDSPKPSRVFSLASVLILVLVLFFGSSLGILSIQHDAEQEIVTRLAEQKLVMKILAASGALTEDEALDFIYQELKHHGVIAEIERELNFIMLNAFEDLERIFEEVRNLDLNSAMAEALEGIRAIHSLETEIDKWLAENAPDYLNTEGPSLSSDFPKSPFAAQPESFERTGNKKISAQKLEEMREIFRIPQLESAASRYSFAARFLHLLNGVAQAAGIAGFSLALYYRKKSA